jgi:hypothetical protein
MNVNTPVGLLNKVWFDIMFHMCRRGREIWGKWTNLPFYLELMLKDYNFSTRSKKNWTKIIGKMICTTVHQKAGKTFQLLDI